MIKEKIGGEPIYKVLNRGQAMEERIFCPIGLMLFFVAVHTQLLEVPQVIVFEPADGGINLDNFLNQQHWPIQVRPPPMVTVVQTTY
jgi:hypothetical protein